MAAPGPMATSPAASTSLERPRLLSALSSAAPLVVLVGPVGTGKTMLLRQWATRHPNVAWAAPHSIPDPTGDVLMIDDADALTETDWARVGELRRSRRRLVIRAAAHSRSAVPTGERAEFIAELAFTDQETQAYLSMRGSPLDARAVQLATRGLPSAVGAVAALKTVRDDIVQALLAELPPGPLSSPHATLAMPEVLTGEVVAGLGGPADFIAECERAGLGEWVADAGHPLFLLTAPVRAATRKVHPQQNAQTVREDAAQTLLGQGAWYGALIEGAAAASLPVIDGALRGGGIPLLQAHGASIMILLRSIHLWELRRWPIIAMAQALIYNARHEHRMRAVELMGIALIGARTAPPGSADRALLRVIESVLQRLLGIGDGGAKSARAAASILSELPADEYRAIEGLLGDLHTHCAISLMYAGHLDEAAAEFERALSNAGRPGIQLISLGGVAVVHALAGDLGSAQRWVDTALEHAWADDILNEYAGSLLRMAQAKIQIEHGELDRAEAALDSVWPIIDTIEHWPLLAHLRAQIDICRGEADAGLERFRALRRSRGSRTTRPQTRLLDLTDSSLALAAGDLASARKLTARADDAAPVAIGAARALVFDGLHERALQMLGTIAAETPGARAQIAVLDAIVLRRLGRPVEAAVAARRAGTIAGTYGLTTPFLLTSVEDRELFDLDVPWPALDARGSVPQLTAREHVILAELIETANVNKIAARLHVSANTVKSQRRSLYRKLGAASREEALAIALGHGLLASTTP
ncbi:LuxR C-terminal-related transcriptional regulator [Microbacterium sp. A204]|uniref:LuxR C-terminal-related transcriptional regulator n=1 Tax=Microbacterium sp. A204 TaxID=3457321 RepID=UPI003FD6B0DE